jgi:OCT family organic cation transporter-like MFS transporter 4/5
MLQELCLFTVLHSINMSFSLQFNLVCDNAHFRVMADSLFMVGALLGSIIFGDLSDR